MDRQDVKVVDTFLWQQTKTSCSMTLIYFSTERFITPEQQKPAIKLCYVTGNPSINHLHCARFSFLRSKHRTKLWFICRSDNSSKWKFLCTFSFSVLASLYYMQVEKFGIWKTLIFWELRKKLQTKGDWNTCHFF